MLWKPMEDQREGEHEGGLCEHQHAEETANNSLWWPLKGAVHKQKGRRGTLKLEWLYFIFAQKAIKPVVQNEKKNSTLSY